MSALSLVLLGLITAAGLLFPAAAHAEATSDSPPANPALARFTAYLTPIFEGGVVGQPIPYAVAIRGDDLVSVLALQPQLANKLQMAMESARQQRQFWWDGKFGYRFQVLGHTVWSAGTCETE
jgi:hypothetical protein